MSSSSGSKSKFTWSTVEFRPDGLKTTTTESVPEKGCHRSSRSWSLPATPVLTPDSPGLQVSPSRSDTEVSAPSRGPKRPGRTTGSFIEQRQLRSTEWEFVHEPFPPPKRTSGSRISPHASSIPAAAQSSSSQDLNDEVPINAVSLPSLPDLELEILDCLKLSLVSKEDQSIFDWTC